MKIQAQHKRRMLRRHQPKCYYPPNGVVPVLEAKVEEMKDKVIMVVKKQ